MGTRRLAPAARSKVVRVLDAHFQQNLDSDAIHASGKSFPANNLREIFAVHGGGILGVRHGDEKPHANFIGRLTGLKVHAGARDALRTAQVFKMIKVRVRRTYAHELGDLAAAAASALGVGGRRWYFRGTSKCGFLRHRIMLGGHDWAFSKRDTAIPEKRVVRGLQPKL